MWAFNILQLKRSVMSSVKWACLVADSTEAMSYMPCTKVLHTGRIEEHVVVIVMVWCGARGCGSTIISTK